MAFVLPPLLYNVVSTVHGEAGDDRIDTLNSVFTVACLIILAALNGGGQYFGSPIKCVIPDGCSKFATQKQTWARFFVISNDFARISFAFFLD